MPFWLWNWNGKYCCSVVLQLDWAYSDILFQIQNFSQVTCCIGREFFTSAKVNYCNLGSTAWTVAMP